MVQAIVLAIIFAVIAFVSKATNSSADTVVPLLVGSYLGFTFNLIAQAMSKANLKITILPDNENSRFLDQGKLLHLRITNEQHKWKLVNFLFGPKLSQFTRAKITFGSGTSAVSVDGRWSSTGEPLDAIFTQGTNGLMFAGNIYSPTKVPGLRFEHLIPGQSENIAIAYKNKGDAEFYAFSNESYAHNFKNPAWKLDGDNMIVQIVLSAGNGEYLKKSYKIRNPSTEIDAFVIEEC